MRALGSLLLLSVLFAGCGDDDRGPTGPVALFKLYPESAAEFYDLPFPSDLRRDLDGTISLAHFPDPRPALLVADYIEAAEELSGFGTTSVTYFRFSESVDASTLPESTEETLEEGATVFLIDVDEAGPSPGRRHPAFVVYQDEPTKYWAAHSVAIRPAIGRPLAWGRRYAAVVTRGVAPAEREAFSRDADFEAILGGGGRSEVAEARAHFEAPLAIVEQAGVPREEILSMTVFTTQDDFVLLEQSRDHLVHELPEPEVVGGLSVVTDGRYTSPSYQLVEGRYTSPTFQHGTLPYSNIHDGGAFELDADGNPIVADEFDQRFTLSIPTTPMPPEGYPIVLYAHGTGGSAFTPMGNGIAERLAAEGIAVMGIDQLHHAPRVDLDVNATQVAVYNVLNPQAFRYNALQAALDVVQQARLVLSPLEIEAESAGLDPGSFEDGIVLFDPYEVHFMGHSQGGQNGPLFLAVDDSARSAMLSGAGGQFTLALLEKVEPLDIPALVAAALVLPGATTEEKLARENVSPEHPILNLLQTWMDVADPVNYAHRFFRDPRPGYSPKHVFMTEGIDDTYTPPPSIEALAVAAGVPLLRPVLEPIDELTRAGEEPACPPVWENAAGGVTAGLSQYAGVDLPFPRDGHFVTFQEPAISQVAEFFRTGVESEDGVPEIVEGNVDPVCEGI